LVGDGPEEFDGSGDEDADGSGDEDGDQCGDRDGHGRGLLVPGVAAVPAQETCTVCVVVVVPWSMRMTALPPESP
jgi:hypothetical protein